VVARDGQFEIYSQAGEVQARAALQWFEQLRATVRQEAGLDFTGRNPVRVIGFGSESEYAPYRMAPMADAYYVGTGDRDYIVMPSLATRSFPTAAHEYAHLIQHAAGSHLPPWLNEGLADLLSTVRIDQRGTWIGGEVNARTNILRHRAWMPLAQLMTLPANSPLRDERNPSQLFYAQSSALAEMMALSPAYRPRFGILIAELEKGVDGPTAVTSTFGKPLDAVKRDLGVWVDRRPKPIALASAETISVAVTIARTPASTVHMMMAGLLLAAGDLKRAESAYRELARETAQTAEMWAGLGAIAAARQQYDEARTLWKRALDGGLSDPDICFRYAELLDRDVGRQDERREALERAVALRPDFDEARWRLAQLENNESHYEAALANLRAMHAVLPARSYSYWNTMTDTLTGLGRGDEAQAAANRASQEAVNAEERAHSAQLAFIARTHLEVQMTRDAAGNPQMVTTRVAKGDTEFNPFVEPSDDLRRVQGKLQEIECGGSGLHTTAMRITVDTAGGRLSLTIPDPTRVKTGNAPPEFTCGPQPGIAVLVQYAATKEKEGIVRGLEFQ
jgi:tetratricopeptide (TPR) repeat protein